MAGIRPPESGRSDCMCRLNAHVAGHGHPVVCCMRAQPIPGTLLGATAGAHCGSSICQQVCPADGVRSELHVHVAKAQGQRHAPAHGLLCDDGHAFMTLA